MTGADIGVDGDLIGRDTEHLRDFGAQGLRVLSVRVNVDGAISAHVANGHGWSNGCVFEIRALVRGLEFLCELARAAATSPLDSPLLDSGTAFQSASSLRKLNRRASPGRPFQSDHLVSEATWRAALIASHSLGATTPMRSPFTTTCVFGKRDLSRVPAETSFEPRVFGWMTRP